MFLLEETAIHAKQNLHENNVLTSYRDAFSVLMLIVFLALMQVSCGDVDTRAP